VKAYRHRELLAEGQRLRGKTHLDMGALDPSQLSENGRLVHATDGQSWHLMTLDESGQVLPCLRYLVHANSVPFSELTIAHSALAQSATWGPTELRQARAQGCSYVEMGGWAITEALRRSTEALRMMVTAFALAEALGGALGIINANLESFSAAILRRIGGTKFNGGTTWNCRRTLKPNIDRSRLKSFALIRRSLILAIRSGCKSAK
jgi:hypothetical protein